MLHADDGAAINVDGPREVHSSNTAVMDSNNDVKVERPIFTLANSESVVVAVPVGCLHNDIGARKN
jgi:hypothetical protein